MGELGALFNPGMRHELEERQAKASRREEEGNARDGDLRIDLESGVAVISIPGADEERPSTEDSAANSDDSAAVGAAPVDTDPADTDPADTDPADTDRADAHSADTNSADTAASSGTDEGAQAADALTAPPVQRPRGKRGLAASHR